MKCVACLSGLKWECREKGNCDESVNAELVGVGNADANPDARERNLPVSDDSDLPPVENEEEVEPSEQFRTYKDDSALKDQQSTGRKRAAKMYPLDPDSECEWQMKKNCGGGEHPIVGCVSGKQDARHHGPEKNTLNNDKGNVHRICHTCHNRWHTLNDPDYVWTAVQNPHSPVEATILDMAESEQFWQGRKVIKAKD